HTVFTITSSYEPVAETSPSAAQLFFFNGAPTPEIYTLSLHDALPIFTYAALAPDADAQARANRESAFLDSLGNAPDQVDSQFARSEEHTSELQSPYDLVCRLLLEKKKMKRTNSSPTRQPF